MIGEDYIANDPVALILGDNLFHGSHLINKLQKANLIKERSTIFGYHVSDPERYAVAKINNLNKLVSITEKPKNPESNIAVTGCYFFDNTIVERAKEIKPSKGELEITDINLSYLNDNKLDMIELGRGTWLDMGTCESLLQANSYVNTIEKRQGFKIGCPEEIAWRNGWISSEDFERKLKKLPDSEYTYYLKNIFRENA